MIWIDSLILTDRGQVKLRDVTPSHRAVTPRGYVPVHEVLAPDHADVRELPVIVFLTARSRSAKTSVVVSPDHLLSVVHPDWDRPRLVRADEVRDTYDLVTLTRYQSSAPTPHSRYRTRRCSTRQHLSERSASGDTHHNLHTDRG